jgi:hypothetical protein
VAGSDGEGGLIWATDAVASPDGRSVVYVSNREAFQAGEAGQSVWLVDYESGDERALLATSGESFTPLGWMGKELLFTGDRGGISAVEPESGRTREVAPGTLLAAEATRGVVAFLDGRAPQNRRLVISGPAGTVRLPRQAGLEYAGSADFSPNGARLAVVLSSPRGGKQLQVVEVASGRFQLLPLPDSRQASLSDPPRWVDDQTVLITTGLRGSGEERSSLLSVPASNAR